MGKRGAGNGLRLYRLAAYNHAVTHGPMEPTYLASAGDAVAEARDLLHLYERVEIRAVIHPRVSAQSLAALLSTGEPDEAMTVSRSSQCWTRDANGEPQWSGSPMTAAHHNPDSLQTYGREGGVS